MQLTLRTSPLEIALTCEMIKKQLFRLQRLYRQKRASIHKYTRIHFKLILFSNTATEKENPEA